MLETYQRILVAVDGSDNSSRAFKHAVEVAKRNEATLYILQVINDQAGSYSPFAYGEIMDGEQKAAEAEMEKYVSYTANHRLKNVVPLVRLENSKTSIARTVPEQFEIDLIIIGATGRGVVNRMIIGSTTNYVVQHAKCNVLVVKQP
ncbi:MAG: universal stress protein [Vagococcus salmoninarum]|uniref:universal stress protein n=1 Tax=Vagococcus salmoninarum TaxID=2739 RepID=UPI003F959C13